MENEEQNKGQNPEENEEQNVSDDKYLRLLAEFDNFRKRTQKEKAELIQTASEKVLKSLLSVLDNFDRAIQAQPEESEGMKLILKQLMEVLNAHGLEEMNVLGKVFSEEIAEAITLLPSEEENKGKIIEVMTKGYQLNGKIIRYPKVIVGN